MRSQGDGNYQYQPSMRFARSLMGQGQNSQMSCDLFNHFSKQLKMRSDKLRDIYHEKSKWAKEMLKHQQSSGAYMQKG